MVPRVFTMRTAPVRCLLLALCAVTGTTSVVASQENTDRFRFDYTRLSQYRVARTKL
jgi:hypothetical protein